MCGKNCVNGASRLSYKDGRYANKTSVLGHAPTWHGDCNTGMRAAHQPART